MSEYERKRRAWTKMRNGMIVLWLAAVPATLWFSDVSDHPSRWVVAGIFFVGALLVGPFFEWVWSKHPPPRED